MGALCCKPEQIDFTAPVDLWHFYLLRSVGKGAFGKVRVVQHKQTKALYALKYINKQRCIKQHAVQNIIQERRLLEEIDCPFVCNLRYAFQDDENLFMVLDLMLGGDLRFHLDRMGFINEDAVRFVVAEIALGLEYLHSKGIVHRDVKPDNILLDEKGHAHLTDFNIAVHYTERRALTSVAGSMAYMAPEVLLKRGYTYTVDWWSLGVTAWELLFGKRPFRGKTNSSLTHCILKDSLKLPETPPQAVSPECISFLKGLLERDYHKRIGCKPSGGMEALKRHPWMQGIDWTALQAKQGIPPFQPDSKKANFDATHELEELLLEDNPLKAKKRDPKKNDLNTMSTEMRLMEETFLVYDHTAMARKSWFPDPQGHTTSTMTANSKQLSIDDQPLASRVSTPIGGPHERSGLSPSSSSVQARPSSLVMDSSAKKAQQQHSYSSTPIEMDEKAGGNSVHPHTEQRWMHAQNVHSHRDVSSPSRPSIPQDDDNTHHQTQQQQQQHAALSSSTSSATSRPLRPTSPYLRNYSHHHNLSNSSLPMPPLPAQGSSHTHAHPNGAEQDSQDERLHSGVPTVH